MKKSLTIIAALALVAFTSSALADVYQPNFYHSDTNAFPLTLTNAQGAAFALGGTGSYKQTVRQNTGLSVFATVVSTNTTTTSDTLGFDVTYDGTNGTTRQQLSMNVPGGFVGTNTFWTNWPGTTFSNVRTIQVTTATNNTTGTYPASNSIVVTKLVYSYSNQ